MWVQFLLAAPNNVNEYMQKIIRNGKVAVLYSPRYGAGWYSWNPNYPELLFDPGLVDLVEEGNEEKILAYVTLKWPNVSTLGIEDLKIEWITQGTEFIIDEYDGAESVLLRDEITWITA
jgi:hypothetical protein